MSVDRLVEQAREYCSGAMRKQGEALVAGLADAVEQLQRDGAEDRAMADRWIDLTQLLTELGMPQDDHTGETAATEDRVRWLADERDEARARVSALEAGVRKALDALDGMAWVDGSHVGDGYASLVTVEDYYVQEEAEDALWALLDGRVPSTGQETT